MPKEETQTQAKKSVPKKVKDKWKAKQEYRILAPEMFGGIEIGRSVADEPAKMIGRTQEVSAQDLTGNIAKSHIKLFFKVNEVKGFDAHTEFVGHDMTSDYIRRLTRRRRTKIEGSYRLTTKDNVLIAIKPVSIAEKHLQSRQEATIRHKIEETLKKVVSEKTLSEVVKDIVSGELSNILAKSCKTVYPLKKIEIRKSVVLKKSALPPAEPEKKEPIEEEIVEEKKE
ncbi:MAG: 30S ribosomal protein S3ae [Thermoplasmata archaeon]